MWLTSTMEAANGPQKEVTNEKPRKRAGKPKVRSGCLTCKTRKVKCDETKPSCLRCQKLDLSCGGYPAPKSRKNEKKPAKHFLLPARVYEPTEKLFGSQEEWRYFQVFRREAVAELTGFFDQGIWERVVLQACHGELFVREAVVAISASWIVRSGKAGAWSSSNILSLIMAKHKEAALVSYGRAIRSMKRELEDGAGDGEMKTRKVLLACLLIVCLEGMWGNSFNALMHAKSGLAVLRAWLEKTPHEKKHQIGIHSPAPVIVEDEIMHAFASLDIQMLTFIDVRTAEEHAAMINEGAETINRMPNTFSRLEESRVYFELIERRAMHFMQVAVCALGDERRGHHGVPDMTTVVAVEDNPAQSWITAGQPFGQKVSQVQARYYQATQNKYIEELKRWNEAFQPLYQKLKQKKELRVFIAASLLFVNFVAVDIIINTCLHTDNSSFDQHREKFRTIVEVSKVIVDAKQSRRFSFSFDSGLTPWLSAVCKWCRDRRVRREAIRLLRAISAQEGVWDSLMIAEIGECMMKLEEEGVETEHIPEEARVRLKHVNMNVAERLLTVECVRGQAEEESIERVIEVNWPFGEWI